MMLKCRAAGEFHSTVPFSSFQQSYDCELHGSQTVILVESHDGVSQKQKLRSPLHNPVCLFACLPFCLSVSVCLSVSAVFSCV